VTVAALDKPNVALAGQPYLDRFDVFVPSLERRWGNQYSQFGEDGLVEALFELIATTNRWCFEVGAADGVFYSNTKRLRDAGWSAVLIEKEHAEFAKLARFESPRVRTVCATVSTTGSPGCRVDDLLMAVSDVPQRLDYAVIDIDGQDYWAWHDMSYHVPRVVLIEYSPYPKRAKDRDTGTVVDVTATYCPPRGGVGQAGIKPILDLGHRKGYREVAITPVNVLFVKEGLLP
jgi:hypothetical protein